MSDFIIDARVIHRELLIPTAFSTWLKEKIRHLQLKENIHFIEHRSTFLVTKEVDTLLRDTFPVDARSLHTQLLVKYQFSKWIASQIKRLKLVEDADYIVKNRGLKNAVEYWVTHRVAKLLRRPTPAKKYTQPEWRVGIWVNMRLLHQFLEVKTAYDLWSARQIELHGLCANVDIIAMEFVHETKRGSRASVVHFLTTDATRKIYPAFETQSVGSDPVMKYLFDNRNWWYPYDDRRYIPDNFNYSK